MIETQDERDVTEIVRCIRSGHSAEAIIQYANTGSAFAMLDPQEHALHTFLVNLVHSTGSLRQISRLAISLPTILATTQVLNTLGFDTLCNRIVHFSYLDNVLRGSHRLNTIPHLLLNRAEQSSSADARDTVAMQDEYLRGGSDISKVPPYQVTAHPWTTLTTDNDAVSHLISLFLVWINPTWRFVEADIFFKGEHKLLRMHSSLASNLVTILTSCLAPQECAQNKFLPSSVRLF